jgi:hypothetical protein
MFTRFECSLCFDFSLVSSVLFSGKDPETGRGKGFAFVTFAQRKDAVKALEKLNGHGFDNLILRVGIYSLVLSVVLFTPFECSFLHSF